MFPTVYLTLLSMVQALALEVLWSTVNQREHLWVWNATALAGWLQAAAMFQLIFFIWAAYAHVVMRFRWVVAVPDSLIPFILGLAQFALIGLLHPERVHLWFYALAATSVFGAWVILVVVGQVWGEPENADLLTVIGPLRPLRYYGPLAGCAVSALAAGILTQRYADSSALIVALTAMTNGSLLGLNAWNARLWRRAIER
jgi:hypothetical protein